MVFEWRRADDPFRKVDVNSLHIQLVSIPDGGLSLAVGIDVAQLVQPVDAQDLPATEDVNLTGMIASAGDHYLFQGLLSGSFQGSCARCLQPATDRFETSVMWVFQLGVPMPASTWGGPDKDDDDDDGGDLGQTGDDVVSVWPFDGHEIDLTPAVWEEIVLAVPLKLLCQSDCGGLCPKCGVNRNQVKCGCKSDDNETMSNKGLAGLANMFPNLLVKQPEE